MQSGLGRDILLTVAVLAGALLVRLGIAALVRLATGSGRQRSESARPRFWVTQLTSIAVLVAVVIGLLSIWVADAGRFASIAGLVTAGLAVALQRVITSFAAYIIVLRGRIFTVGDRITLGGVRGDVVRVGFMQTSVMEMGGPPSIQHDVPDVWVAARQYTGRLVSVTNDKIFDNPVYNYTREFPFLWDEMAFPIKYGADYERAESILLAVATRHAHEYAEKAQAPLEKLRRRYVLAEVITLEPKVYVRLTDNWIELTLRFLAPVHGVRALKDAMGRDILVGFADANLEIASGTYEIVGIPTIRIAQDPRPA